MFKRPQESEILEPLRSIPHSSASISYNRSSSLLQSALNSLPVNHIPNRTEILRLAVLILQVIRMLPSIDTQQRRELAYDRVLVGICTDQDLTSFVVFDEPGPAAALDTCESGVELCFEGGEIAVAGFD